MIVVSDYCITFAPGLSYESLSYCSSLYTLIKQTFPIIIPSFL